MRRRPLRRLSGCRRGATALEFAIAGPVMLLLIFAVIDDSVMLFAQSVLENATRDASRQVMIGSITTSAAFQSRLCSDVTTFFDCTKLQVNVSSSATGFPNTVIGVVGGVLNTLGFTPGTGGQYVTVQVVYSRPYMFPYIQGFAGTGWTLMSVQSFQNEPFS